MRRARVLVAIGIGCGALGAGLAVLRAKWEPGGDRGFVARVESPALRQRAPVVLFDHGHRNSHSVAGRYAAFARLMRADGCRVRQISGRIDARRLEGAAILAIVNAKGPESDPVSAAFDDGECDAIRNWVQDGGGLLLVADHHPCGEAAASLAARFGVEMSGGWTDDSTQARPGSGDPGQIVFTRSGGTLASHPITDGDGGASRVDTVETFTGQSLRGPADAVPLLLLGEAAMDRIPTSSKTESHGTTHVTTFETEDRSAAGRAQGLAFHHGRGRVVVLAEAAMLTAQIQNGHRFGMNAPGNHNRQFALNTVRWLAGAQDAATP